eukprot:scaffold579072_cov11-Prasinocladus_malaysianus.AAC.1
MTDRQDWISANQMARYFWVCFCRKTCGIYNRIFVTMIYATHADIITKVYAMTHVLARSPAYYAMTIMKSAAIYLNRKRGMLACDQSYGNFGSFCRYYTYTSTFTSKDKVLGL